MVLVLVMLNLNKMVLIQVPLGKMSNLMPLLRKLLILLFGLQVTVLVLVILN